MRRDLMKSVPADNTKRDSAERPFGRAARGYRANGWLGTLPLPARSKQQPPSDFTGNGAPYPTDVDVRRWRKFNGDGNICLRLADVPREFLADRDDLPPIYAGNNVDGWALIGIDVDDYGEKHGLTDLKELEAELGPLPATVVSSARWGDAPASGIRLFLVPKGYRYKGKAAKHIDIIHAGHRYAVVWPSVHPSGSQYEFRYGAAGSGAELEVYDPAGVPPVADVAVLPESWFTYLLSGSGDFADAKSGMEFGELEDWAEATLHDCMGNPCRLMAADLAKYLDALDESDQHHPLNTVIWRLTQNALEGHSGWYTTVRAYIDQWVEVSKGKRHPDEMQAEVVRNVTGALDKAKPMLDERGGYVPEDTCAVDASRYDSEGWAARVEEVCEAVEDDDVSFSTGDHSGQVRLAHFLAKYYAGRLIHVKNSAEGWFYWADTHWREDDTGRAVEAVKDTLKRAFTESFEYEDEDARKRLQSDINKCLSASGVMGVLKMASSDPAFARSIDQLDSDPNLVNMPNGTLDLRTFTVRPNNPAELITKITRGRYRGDGTDSVGPVWKSHLERVLPGEALRRFLLQLLGIALPGKLPEPNMLVIFHGEKGRNGKSKTFEAVIHALGDYGLKANSELLLDKKHATHPTERYALRGRRFAVTSEIKSGAKMNAALMKELTGDKTYSARAMHRNEITFPVTWLLVMVTNHLPHVDAGDDAVWKRIKAIPFDVVLPPNEWNLKLGDELEAQEEADGVLTSMVLGYRDFVENGLREPEQVTNATNRYRLRNDDAGQFVVERCLTGAEALEALAAGGINPQPTELHEAYMKWFNSSQGVRAIPLGRKQFGAAMDRLGFETYAAADKKRRRAGIVLKGDEEEVE